MSMLSDSAVTTWGVAGLATAGVIIRPWRIPEAAWAVVGAAALVGSGLLPWADALVGVRKGFDVYLFLIDRETGKPLLPIEERKVSQDPAMHTSPTQPFPVNADSLGPPCGYWQCVPELAMMRPGVVFVDWSPVRPGVDPTTAATVK